MDKISTNLEQIGVAVDKLYFVLGKIFDKDISNVAYDYELLHGGTVGEAYLVSGTVEVGAAETGVGEIVPFKVVLKIQKKWDRYGDPNSWRREYDLYSSQLHLSFEDEFSWPKCYLSELEDERTILWMEYVNGVSGTDLTVEMYEMAAKALGKFQGKLLSNPKTIKGNIANLSEVGFIKSYYLRYRGWNEVYDYIRADDCEVPKHICDMIIDFDENADAIWQRIEGLPVVLTHRDFWVENIFSSNEKVVVIDWDTTGMGYLGEDIASLIADESNVEYMLELYKRCTSAYYEGIAEFVGDLSVQDNCIYELIIIMFGYRLIEWYKFADTKDEKDYQLKVLQEIYKMRQVRDLKR